MECTNIRVWLRLIFGFILSSSITACFRRPFAGSALQGEGSASRASMSRSQTSIVAVIEMIATAWVRNHIFFDVLAKWIFFRDENCVWYSPVPTLVYNRMGKFARIVFRIVESSVAATLKSHQSAVSAGNELGTVVGVCVVSVLFYAAGVISDWNMRISIAIIPIRVAFPDTGMSKIRPHLAGITVSRLCNFSFESTLVGNCAVLRVSHPLTGLHSPTNILCVGNARKEAKEGDSEIQVHFDDQGLLGRGMHLNYIVAKAHSS